MKYPHDYDVVIIGSGFGGSVSALRLSEKGYKVAVIEAGRRFKDSDFPKTSWRLRRFLYAPRLGLNGIQRIHALPDVLVLCGAGVGGGSLVYANTLYTPPDTYFNDQQWRHITDWKSELAPWYELAHRMLGVAKNPFMSPSDVAMKEVADEMGVGHTFTLAPLGIFFGEGSGKESEDPFFGGIGPSRRGCTHCGECMTGCRHNAKNTLPKNYLGIAEGIGAIVIPDTTVTAIGQTENGWTIQTRRSSSWFGRGRTFTAKEVIVAAGTYNTQKLLHRMKDSHSLPKLSSTLGNLSRTNSEALTGALMSDTSIDYSQGAAITSSFHPDEHTHVEPVRYGKGSNSMGLLQTIATDGTNLVQRHKQWWKTVLRNPSMLYRVYNVRKWSERTVIALVMQNVDSAITVRGKRSLFGWRLTSRNDSDKPNATYIPAANEVVRRVAKNRGGIPGGNLGELINAPFTAHFVGGCVIGDSDKSGVIDPYHRVWNYPTLHIVDGSSVTANLGVNPSLTITAQAERAMSMWPNKGDVDLRPSQEESYRVVEAIYPNSPAIPQSAPAALKRSVKK
jgi:cholesterol oxidase